MENFSTFGGMKVKRTSIKVDEKMIKAVKRLIKGTKATIGEYVEIATKKQIDPRYVVHDNSTAFQDWLSMKDIKFDRSDHCTIIVGQLDIFHIGKEFGIYAAKNNPSLRDKAMNQLHENIIGQDPHNPL